MSGITSYARYIFIILAKVEAARAARDQFI
jgi:hypothetical protein